MTATCPHPNTKIEIAMSTLTLEEIIKFPPMQHEVGSIGFIEKMILGTLVLVTQPQVVVETGVFKGQTTQFLAEFTRLNGLSTQIVGFDLPDVVQQLLESSSLPRQDNVTLVPGRLPYSLKDWLSGNRKPIAVAVIDAGHTFDAVMSELLLIEPHICSGGYIFCHDYRPGDSGYEGVWVAVDSFSEKYGYERVALNPSLYHGEEVVWGSALLRKPLVSQPAAYEFRYRLRGLMRYWRKKYLHRRGFSLPLRKRA